MAKIARGNKTHVTGRGRTENKMAVTDVEVQMSEQGNGSLASRANYMVCIILELTFALPLNLLPSHKIILDRKTPMIVLANCDKDAENAQNS